MSILKGHNNKKNKINFKEISTNYFYDSDNSKILTDDNGQDFNKFHVIINIEIIENKFLKKDLLLYLFNENNPDKSKTVKIYDNTYMLKKRLINTEINEIIKFIEKLFIEYGNNIEHEISVIYFPNGKTLRSKSN